MVKKTIILLVLYFLHFTLLVCGEKNILPNLTNSPESVFWPLGAGAARKKYKEPEPLEKKKSGAGADKKFAGSSSLPYRLQKTIRGGHTITQTSYFQHVW